LNPDHPVVEAVARRLIALMMEEARTSEKSIDNYFTRQYIPEEKPNLMEIILSELTLTSSIQLNLSKFTAVNNLVAMFTMEHKQYKTHSLARLTSIILKLLKLLY
jgi:hypothetical protein